MFENKTAGRLYRTSEAQDWIIARPSLLLHCSTAQLRVSWAYHARPVLEASPGRRHQRFPYLALVDPCVGAELQIRGNYLCPLNYIYSSANVNWYSRSDYSGTSKYGMGGLQSILATWVNFL